MRETVRLVSPLERALFLKSVDPLRALSAAELAEISRRARERQLARGELLFRAGEPAECLHVIVEGRVLTRGAEHGKADHGPGATLGLLSMLARWEAGLEATAETETLTLELRADDLFDVLEDNVALLHHEVRELARQMLLERREIATGTLLAPAVGLVECSERELDLIERILFLTRGISFQQVNLDAMIQIARLHTEERIPAGRRLWRRGDPSGFVYMIAGGTVRCTLEGGERWFRAGAGYPLGNIESLCNLPRWYEAVAEEPVIALHVETDAFFDVLEDHFAVSMDFLATLASGVLRVREERRAEAKATGAEATETAVSAAD